MKRYFPVLVVIFTVLVWAAPVQAATVPAGFKTWTEQTTTDTLKAWTVEFNASMDLNTMNSSNIYVTDDSNVLFKTTLTRSTDGASVLIKPVSAYTVGKKYWLFMTGDITTNGSGKQRLSKPLVMPFLVTAPGSKISSISSSYSSLLTSFTVLTSSDVYRVKVNQSEMMYQGSNTFALGMVGLKQGSTVKVYAYDSNGKLLQTLSHTVN